MVKNPLNMVEGNIEIFSCEMTKNPHSEIFSLAKPMHSLEKHSKISTFKIFDNPPKIESIILEQHSKFPF